MKNRKLDLLVDGKESYVFEVSYLLFLINAFWKGSRSRSKRRL